MANRRLNLKSIVELDMGKMAAVFDAQLRHILDDVQDRPAEGKKRSVTLTVTVAPAKEDFKEKGGNRMTDALDVRFEVGSKVPGLHSRGYPMLSGPDGTATYNDASLNDPRQLTIDDVENRKARKGGK